MITTPLVSLADVMAHLPVRSGNASYDERIQLLIDTATQQIEAATRRSFTRQQHSEYFRTLSNSDSRYDLFGVDNEYGTYTYAREIRYVLRGIPISTAVETPFTVYYDPSRVFGADTAVDPASYSLRTESSQLFVRMPMAEGPDFLKVVYTAGYADDGETVPTLVGVPADLRLACIAQVTHLFTRMTTDNIGVDVADRSSKSAMEARFMTRGGLTPEAAALVSRYRQPLLGLG